MSDALKAIEDDVAYLARNMSGIPMSEWNAISNRILAAARALTAAEARAEAAEAKLAEALLNPDPWRPIEEAPKDGTRLEVLYANGDEEVGVYWSDDRYCIIGAPMGSRGPGWVSTEAGNLPVDPPTHFRELKGPGQ